MDLFTHDHDSKELGGSPLADRVRPEVLDDVLGQEHILGPGKLLRRAIEADRLGSIILYGPPGCGKTSLAEVIAVATDRRFDRTSGATSNVAVLRGILAKAWMRKQNEGIDTILFIDEIHRFSKSQQDVLLHDVEKGGITLVGATTHNPMYFINTPLTSRSLIFKLRPLSEDAVRILVHRAIMHPSGLASYNIKIDEDAVHHLASVCEGDARRALNALEVATITTSTDKSDAIHITRQVIEDSIQQKAVVYDQDEDGHYDTISAFIKSMRGSDPHAAVYWLGKMLKAGEEIRFIARRMIIFASEDVGNADPRALNLAVSTMQAVELVGMPEARIILAQAATYLSTAPKSNASYVAIEKVSKDIEEGRVLEVPEQLKNVKLETADKEGKDDSDEYKYPHDYKGNFVDQEYIPTSNRYYEPDGHGYEETIRKRLERWDALRDRKPVAEGEKTEAGIEKPEAETKESKGKEEKEEK